MRACPACCGFLPDHVTACPNCRRVSRWRRLGRALAMLAGGVSASVTLAACYGVAPYDDGCPDSDNDGWLPGCYNDDHSCDPEDRNCDCNEWDPATHPGADDPPTDGIDRDCDGKDTPAPQEPPFADAMWVADAEPAPDAL